MRAWLRRTACLTGLVALTSVASAHASESVTYQATPQHTGAIDEAITPPLGVRWARNMGAESSYPVVAGGRVFVTTKSTSTTYGSTLYALDATNGAVIWSRPLSHTYYWSALAYDDGRLFALDYDGVLQAFAADSGAALWGKQLPGQYAFSSPPVAVGGVVYTGGAGSGGTVYAVRASDGQVLWTGSVANGDNSSPAVDSAHMYVSYACAQAYSFATAGGALAWHHSTGCSGGGGKTPVLYDGKLYIRDSGPNLILAAGSGAELGSFGSNVAPAFSGDVALYMAGSQLVAERTSDRTPMWSFTGDGNLVSAPFVAGSTVFEGSTSGALFALDRDSGAVLWSDCLPGPVAPPDEQNVSQPMTGIGAGGGLLVVPAGPSLVAYEARPGAPSYTCGGTAPAPAPSPVAPGVTPSTGSANGVTLAAGRDIRFGQVATLRGRATPGAAVTLQSDAFPFGTFAPRKSTTAAADGSFSFRVRPDRNTAFKAVAAGAESAGVIVYVDVAGAVGHRGLRNGRMLVRSVVLGPPDLPYRKRVLHFYVLSGKTARHIGSRRLTGRRGTFKAALTTAARAKHYAVCLRERKPDAWGRPTAADRRCGARRLRVP